MYSNTDQDSYTPATRAKYPAYNRQARIYFQNVNAMQKCPIFLRVGWRIQFEVQNLYKTHNMGWTFTDDPSSVRSIDCYSLEDAIHRCRAMG